MSNLVIKLVKCRLFTYILKTIVDHLLMNYKWKHGASSMSRSNLTSKRGFKLRFCKINCTIVRMMFFDTFACSRCKTRLIFCKFMIYEEIYSIYWDLLRTDIKCKEMVKLGSLYLLTTHLHIMTAAPQKQS